MLVVLLLFKLFQQGWILFIVVTIANGFVYKKRGEQFIEQNPDLKPGYDLIFRYWMIWANVPWVIMGIGNITGLTNNVFDYFRPRTLNPAVLVFHSTILILYVLSIWWIYAKNGAEFLEQHPGLLKWKGINSGGYLTAREIRLFFPLMIFAGLTAMLFMWLMNIPDLQTVH